MSDLNCDKLRQRLLCGGVAPRHVARAVQELRDHFEDLESEAISQGLSDQAANKYATRNIGGGEQITELYFSRRELKCWSFRHQRLAIVILPIAYVLMLPTVPVAACATNAPAIARWCTCLLLSAFVTAGMLLAMQFSIASG